MGENIPIIAIGGILPNDIEDLLQSGIHGIAAAGAVLAENNIELNIQKYQQIIHS